MEQVDAAAAAFSQPIMVRPERAAVGFASRELLQESVWWGANPASVAFAQTAVNQAIVACALERSAWPTALIPKLWETRATLLAASRRCRFGSAADLSTRWRRQLHPPRRRPEWNRRSQQAASDIGCGLTPPTRQTPKSSARGGHGVLMLRMSRQEVAARIQRALRFVADTGYPGGKGFACAT